MVANIKRTHRFFPTRNQKVANATWLLARNSINKIVSYPIGAAQEGQSQPPTISVVGDGSVMKGGGGAPLSPLSVPFGTPLTFLFALISSPVD